MGDKSSILSEELGYVIDSLDRHVENLGEKEYLYRLTPESNNIQWLLNHMSRIVNISIPRIVKGDSNYSPKGWPADYKDQAYSLEKLMKDIKSGRKAAVEGLAKLKDEQLEEEIPLWGGKQKRKTGVFAYIGEIYHHRGQLAFIRGTIKRLKEKDPGFLK
jgi:uncharacterized damage-inducible protein DinB